MVNVVVDHALQAGSSLPSEEHGQKNIDKNGSQSLHEAKQLLAQLPEEIRTKIYGKTPLPILLDQFELEHSCSMERFKKACTMSRIYPEEEEAEADYVLEFKNILSMLRNQPMPDSYKRRIRRRSESYYVSVGKPKPLRRFDDKGGIFAMCNSEDISTEFFWEHYNSDEPPLFMVRYEKFNAGRWFFIDHKMYFMGENGWNDGSILYIKRFDPATGKTFIICELPIELESGVSNHFAVSNNTVLFAFENDSIIWIFTVNGDKVDTNKIIGEVLMEIWWDSFVVSCFDEDGLHKIVKILSLVNGELIERVVQRSRWVTACVINPQFFYLIDDTKRRIWYQDVAGATPICVHEDDQPLYVEQFLFSSEELDGWMKGNPHGLIHPQLRGNNE